MKTVRKLLALTLSLAMLATMSITAFAATRENEPNDAFATATAMAVNTEYVGFLQTTNDYDYYKFTLDSSDIATITFNYTTGVPHMAIVLYDSKSNVLWREGTGDDKVMPYTSDRQSLNAGTYYILIADAGNRSGRDDYTIKVNTEKSHGAPPTQEPTNPGDNTQPTNPGGNTQPTPPTLTDGGRETEPNDGFAQAMGIAVNTSYTAYLQDTTDVDVFMFTLQSDDLVKLQFNYTSGVAHMYIYLYESSSKEVYRMGMGDDKVMPFTSDRLSLTAGTYYILIADAGNRSGRDDYTIAVLTEKAHSGKPSRPTSFTGINEVEPNDSFAQANHIPVKKAVVGSLSSVTDYDYYKFTLDSSDIVTLSYDYIGSAYPHMYIALYDGSSNEVWHTGTGTDKVVPFTSDRQSLNAGTYYILLADSGNRSGRGDYTLTVNTTKDHKYTGSLGATPQQPGNTGSTGGSSAGASSWAVAEIDEALALGFVPAELASSYQTNITRAEYCKLVVMMLMAKSATLSNEQAFVSAYNIDLSAEPFTDTSDRYIKIAYALQIVNGTGNNMFSPGNSITRQDAATMIKRAAAVFEFTTSSSSPINFSDKGAVASYASQAVDFVSAIGVMGGTGNNMFSPHGNYTREQSILTMVRLYKAFPRDNYAV